MILFISRNNIVAAPISAPKKPVKKIVDSFRKPIEVSIDFSVGALLTIFKR